MNPDIYNDKNVCQSIKELFQKPFETEEERWTFYSFIDNYLKWLSSKEDSNELIKQIREICIENGYSPQYNVSGWSTFYTDNSRFSKDSKFIIAQNERSAMIIFSGEMRPYAAFFNRRADNTDLSPNGDLLVNYYYSKENDYNIEIWDTKTFRIIFESDTSAKKIWWAESGSFYYADKNRKLVKYDISSGITDTDVILDNDVFTFAVDETNKLVISLGDRTYIDNLETGDCYQFDIEMSVDSEIHVSKDGFRVFSNGILYSIKDKSEILFELKESSISRSFNPGRLINSIYGFRRDERGIYAFTDAGIRYYLDKNGIRSVAYYNNRSEVSLEVYEQIEQFRVVNPSIQIDGGAEGRAQYISEKLRSMESVAIMDGYNTVCILRPLGMASPFVPQAEVFIFSNLPFVWSKDQKTNGLPIINTTEIRVLNVDLFDISSLKADDGQKFRIIREFGFDLLASSTVVDDFTPMTRFLLAALPQGNLNYQMSSDGDRYSICATVNEYYNPITIIIRDSGEYRCIKGKLIDTHRNESACMKPILRMENRWCSIEADGRCTELNVGEDASEVLCTGDTVLWRSGNNWYNGKDDITSLIPKNHGHLALISDDYLALNKYDEVMIICIKDGTCRVVNTLEGCYWYVLGLSDSGFLSMVHFVRYGVNVTANFAELNMNTGIWKDIDGTLDLTVSLSESLGMNFSEESNNRVGRMWGTPFNYVDLRKQKILEIGSNMDKPMLNRYDLTKGVIKQSRNGLRANFTKKWVNPAELNNGLYLIATTECDENEQSDKDEDKRDKGLPRRRSANLRPELRIMDSRTGLRFKNGNRYGGIMYGPKGYSLRETIRPLILSPDRNYVFATYDSPEVSINSFDVRVQKTYPDVPIHGVVLSFPAADRVLIGLFDDNGTIGQCQMFDYMLNPMDEPQRMLFRARDMFDGISYELPDNTDVTGDHWSSYGYTRTIGKQSDLLCINESESGKTEVDVDLTYVYCGIVKNKIKWHTRIVPEYENPTVDEIMDRVKKTVKFSSSETITAVFDMGDIDQKSRNGEYVSEIIRGENHIRITIQSPFSVDGGYEMNLCPVHVIEDMFTYSVTENGCTRIRRCRFTEGGEIIEINSLYTGDESHYIPLFSEEGLLILRREDGGLFYSDNWGDLHAIEFDHRSSYLLNINLFLDSKRNGEYLLMNEYGKIRFTDGRLVDDRGIHNYPSELKMPTGTLEWKEGIFIVRL